MLKTDSLREAMTRSCRWCQANPEKFTIFVESGNIETTGETPSFVYRYQMVMFVMDISTSSDCMQEGTSIFVDLTQRFRTYLCSII